MLDQAVRTELRLGPLEVPVVDALVAAACVATSLTLLHNQPIDPAQQLALIVVGLLVVVRHSRSMVAVVLLLAILGLLIGVVALSIEMLQDPVMGPAGIVIFAPLLSSSAGPRSSRGTAPRRRLAVELERDRLDSELQEVIADGLRAMLAATAQARDGGVGLEDALAGVEARGRLLLDDMRGMLGVLRRHPPGEVRAPQPSLRDVDRLLADARTRGVPVSLRREGDEQPLASSPDRSAYRIIERALQDATEAPVDVCLRWRDREVEVEIDAPADPRWPTVLAAARERTALCGGHVAATRPAPGRASLRACLPLAGVRA